MDQNNAIEFLKQKLEESLKENEHFIVSTIYTRHKTKVILVKDDLKNKKIENLYKQIVFLDDGIDFEPTFKILCACTPEIQQNLHSTCKETFQISWQT
jgi:hypothetical protein